MRFIALSAVLALLGSAAHAQTPTAVDVATVSMTPAGVSRLVTNTICATDGRDLVCDGGAQLLSNGVISATGLTVNGVSITGSSSATSAVAFYATAGQAAGAGWATTAGYSVSRNDGNAFNGTTGVFTAPYDGWYQFNGRLHVTAASNGWGIGSQIQAASGGCEAFDYAAGGYNYNGCATSIYLQAGQTASFRIVSHNGTTAAAQWFSGYLINGYMTPISASTALGDRITSGTASGVVAMAGGTVSFTTGGTSGTAYLDTVGRFVGVGVSTTGAISATSIYAGASLQLASPTAVTACNSTAAGTIRYNSPTTTLELCTGSGWQPMGVGIPAGTISAFASTTCPTGWSEYTAARGRFLRGIDNGAGNDGDGTRAPGATQGDRLADHKHYTTMGFDSGQFYGWQDGSGQPIAGSRVVVGATRTIASAVTQPSENIRLALTEIQELPIAGETRPKNVAVTYCQFNGTSNGWNNPLSGGSTTAAGSTGQLQYNTGNAFDASAGLTWTNASSLLGVAGTVSTTSITVGGLTLQQILASATTAQGDRITSGTSAVAVNSATGIVSITQLGAVTSYVHPSLGYVGPGVSATGTVSGSRVATNDVKLSGVGGSCSVTEDYGRMFRNPTTGRLQLCMPRP